MSTLQPISPEELQRQLAGFCGTLDYHRLTASIKPEILWTDGCSFLAEHAPVQPIRGHGLAELAAHPGRGPGLNGVAARIGKCVVHTVELDDLGIGPVGQQRLL